MGEGGGGEGRGWCDGVGLGGVGEGGVMGLGWGGEGEGRGERGGDRGCEGVGVGRLIWASW